MKSEASLVALLLSGLILTFLTLALPDGAWQWACAGMFTVDAMIVASMFRKVNR